MIIAAMLIGMMQAAEPVATIPDRQTLTLPNEIAPALLPYLACMLQDRNSRILGAHTGEAARAGIEQLKADCRLDRDKAQAHAREMLSASNVPDSVREAMIATSLGSIDNSRDNIARRLEQANTVKKQAID